MEEETAQAMLMSIAMPTCRNAPRKAPMTMIEKIVSGGQTGADRAALDVALEMGIPHGGWIPKGRKTEEGVLPEKYRLKEMPTRSYADRTERNVLESDGTLILSHGRLKGGSALTRELAVKHGRPWLHVDFKTANPFMAARNIRYWAMRHEIKVLNVAGSRASEDPEMYESAAKLLRTVLHMDIVQANMPDSMRATPFLPESVEEAVERLLEELPLKERMRIARMDEEQIRRLFPTLGTYIRDRFGLNAGNHDLLQSCRYLSKKYEIQENEASFLVLKELWKKLKETHALRVVR
jgi:hypothetical protein